MPIKYDNLREGPGFKRLKERMGEEAFEKLRQDTLRRQQEALANVPPPGPGISGNMPHDIVRDVIRGKRK
jgi:hypothetical protein